jgi:hypothetical protein
MVGRNAGLNKAERCSDGSIAVGGVTLLENLKLFSKQAGQPHLETVLQKTDHICGETPVNSQASLDTSIMNSKETGDCANQGTGVHIHSAADLCL